MPKLSELTPTDLPWVMHVVTSGPTYGAVTIAHETSDELIATVHGENAIVNAAMIIDAVTKIDDLRTTKDELMRYCPDHKVKTDTSAIIHAAKCIDRCPGCKFISLLEKL